MGDNSPNSQTIATMQPTVQLGYCDSDVTVCLLFWNMPIIQDRDIKYPYKQYILFTSIKSNCVPVEKKHLYPSGYIDVPQ